MAPVTNKNRVGKSSMIQRQIYIEPESQQQDTNPGDVFLLILLRISTM